MKNKFLSIPLSFVCLILFLIPISSTASAFNVQSDSPTATYAYITNNADNTVSVIDTETNTVTATVNVEGGPIGVAVSPDGTNVYVTNEDSNTVSVIDTATNKVTATVKVGSGAKGIAVTPDGEKVYVTNYGGNTVSVISTAANKVIATVGVKNSPWAVAVSPDGTEVYVTNDVSGTVSVINTATDTVTTTVNVENQSPGGVAVSPDGTNVYVTSGSSNTVAIISTETKSVTNTVNVGNSPHGVAVTPDGTNVYVANFGSKTVSVISTAANEVTNTVNVGNSPYGVAVSPDGTKVYVPDRDDNTVSVIDTATNTVTTAVNVGKRPKALGQFIGYIPVKPRLPVADFSASQTSGNKPLSVSFYDISTGSPTSWYWDFGDGATSAERSPAHTYTEAGNYIVDLTVDNENGADSKTQEISVQEAQNEDKVLPVADFGSNLVSGFAPLDVQFTDSSQNANRWSWDFNNDGIADSSDVSPVYTYTTPGTYTVSLTVSNANGTDSKTIKIIVDEAPSDDKVLPVSDFSTSILSGYAPFSVQFTDKSESATLWKWDFGDGTTATEQNPAHTYSATGTYTVTLTVSSAKGTHSKIATITLMEDSSSSGGSSSSGSSGSGGGGGGSPEPQSNVDTKELSQVYITSGNPVKFDFKKNVTSVVYINFDSRKTAGKTTTIVEMLKGKSTLVSGLPSDEVYKSLNIWVGNSGFATPRNIENAVVCFKVEKSWIQDKSIDQSSITLNRCSDRKWNSLPTSLLSEDDKYMYFTAQTPGFSPFAITGKTTEQSGDTAKDQPEASSASVNLHGEKTKFLMGEEILLKLSAVNLITKPTMHVQVIIIPPSGMSVSSSEFVESGAGQYTTTYDLEPGKGRDIEVRIAANQVGDFNVKGRVVYYFGDNKKDGYDYPLDLPIQVGEAPETKSANQPTPYSMPHTSGLGVASTVFILIIVFLLRRK